jgi:quercetin dioxygenase-like cupin family protein
VTTDTYPGLAPAPYRARNRTREQIKQTGAVGNVNDGIEIETHGLRTRLLAWPGNGLERGSIHLLTLAPGDTGAMHQYDQAEQGMICIKGTGEVFVRGQWVDIVAGDVVYVPEGVEHAVRNPSTNHRDFVLLTQLTPPQFDLYEPAGLYDRATQTLQYDAIDAAVATATYGTIAPDNELQFSDRHPALRAWNLRRDEVRRGGALFNYFMGASFAGIGVPMRFILWPGHGTRTAEMHAGLIPADGAADTHTHPSADDCIFVWEGSTACYIGGDWVPIGPLEAALAPCGVQHGGRGNAASGKPALVNGFGAPAQLDLHMKTDYYHDGIYTTPPFERLELPAQG